MTAKESEAVLVLFGLVALVYFPLVLHDEDSLARMRKRQKEELRKEAMRRILKDRT